MFESKLLSALKDDDGYLVDAEGLHHESASDYMCHVLGFCGCGVPESALAYVRDAMKAIQAMTERGYAKPDIDACYRMFASDGERYFVWYRLDNLELTEHGGSVPGWLTDKGKDWLVALDEALEQEVE